MRESTSDIIDNVNSGKYSLVVGDPVVEYCGVVSARIEKTIYSCVVDFNTLLYKSLYPVSTKILKDKDKDNNILTCKEMLGIIPQGRKNSIYFKKYGTSLFYWLNSGYVDLLEGKRAQQAVVDFLDLKKNIRSFISNFKKIEVCDFYEAETIPLCINTLMIKNAHIRKEKVFVPKENINVCLKEAFYDVLFSKKNHVLDYVSCDHLYERQFPIYMRKDGNVMLSTFHINVDSYTDIFLNSFNEISLNHQSNHYLEFNIERVATEILNAYINLTDYIQSELLKLKNKYNYEILLNSIGEEGCAI